MSPALPPPPPGSAFCSGWKAVWSQKAPCPDPVCVILHTILTISEPECLRLNDGPGYTSPPGLWEVAVLAVSRARTWSVGSCLGPVLWCFLGLCCWEVTTKGSHWGGGSSWANLFRNRWNLLGTQTALRPWSLTARSPEFLFSFLSP